MVMQIEKGTAAIYNVSLEFMKKLIKYMRDLFDILAKNQNLIIERNLPPSVQFASFSVGLCALNESTIFYTISVEPIEHTLIVGMHKIVKCSTTWPTNIFFTFDSLNNLELALDEADNKVNILDADLKGRCKFKKGNFIRQSDMKNLIHEKTATQCGTYMYFNKARIFDYSITDYYPKKDLHISLTYTYLHIIILVHFQTSPFVYLL